MTADKIKFGTDGWRGVIAEDFTFANVRCAAQAYADYLRDTHGEGRTVIVGYDNRFMSDVYAKLVCEVFAANGFRSLYPPEGVPTPAVSYTVKEQGLCGGVMITASHNPPEFNGFKIKAHYAGSADPEICAQVEARVGRSEARIMHFDEGTRAGMIEFFDPRPSYVRAIKRCVDFKKIRSSRIKAVADAMCGVGDGILERQFKGARCRVVSIRTERDVLFGGVNPEPITKNLGALSEAVLREKADIGLATDGDADRVGMVDERGHYVTVQMVFAMVLLHLLRNRKEKGLVVKSSNSTVWVDRICRAHGLEWVEAPVGFKHICQIMRQREAEAPERQVLVGGEESGGLGFRGHIPERDGLLAALVLLEMLAMEKRSVTMIARDIEREFGRFVYDRVDISYPVEKRLSLLERLGKSPPDRLLRSPLREIKCDDGVKLIAADDTWLMFRASGTEPVLRIYAEGSDRESARRLLELGRRLAHTVL